MTETKSLTRPKKTTVAIYLIVISTILGIFISHTGVISIDLFDNGTDAAKPASSVTHNTWVMPHEWFIYVVSLAIALFALYLFCLYQMSLGKKWGRTVFLIVVIYTIISYLIHPFLKERQPDPLLS